MKLLVEGEISATSYKKLVAKLKNLSKKQLWEVLDHYIFHVMNDANVIELLNILDERALERDPINRTFPQQDATASASDDDMFFHVDPKVKFRPRAISTLPTDEMLLAGKGELDLLYDYNCFDSYIEPEIRASVAKKLIEFAESNGVPVADHWIDFSHTE